MYVPLFLMLVYVYYTMQPGGTFRGRTIKYTRAEFRTVFPYFAAVFAVGSVVSEEPGEGL